MKRSVVEGMVDRHIGIPSFPYFPFATLLFLVVYSLLLCTYIGDNRAILTRNHYQRDQCRACAQSPRERIRRILPGTSPVGYQASQVRVSRVSFTEQLRHKSSIFYSISHHFSYSTPRATTPAFSLFACFRPPTRIQITNPVPRTPLGSTSTSTP
jgi:hypothetical protein